MCSLRSEGSVGRRTKRQLQTLDQILAPRNSGAWLQGHRAFKVVGEYTVDRDTVFQCDLLLKDRDRRLAGVDSDKKLDFLAVIFGLGRTVVLQNGRNYYSGIRAPS
ncbi:hypothetical protein PM082_011857 [Marasmius tenuissimus]|nr:hypothetical protein PM082_011857 [Marasmius tenuissimus]